MRVLLVTNMYPSKSAPSFGIFVRDQLEALKTDHGLDVTLWDFQGGGVNYLKAMRELRRFARARKFDLVLSHYGLSGLVSLAVRGTPQIVTFHGTDLRHPLVGPVSRWVAARIAQPAVASKPLLDQLPRRVAECSVILPTGLNMKRLTPTDKDSARRTLGLNRKAKYLLFPSDPSRKVKRYDRAQSISERLPGTELLLMTDIDPSEVRLWIGAADAVLITSDAEGFALGVVEALACNRPVISTPVGVAPLALHGLEQCLCADFDLDTWEAALAPLLSQNDQTPFEGRSRAQLFSTTRMAKRVLAVMKATSASSVWQPSDRQ